MRMRMRVLTALTRCRFRRWLVSHTDARAAAETLAAPRPLARPSRPHHLHASRRSLEYASHVAQSHPASSLAQQR